MEAVGEVFVVVNGDGTTVGFKDVDTGFEEFVAGIEFLAFFIGGIFAVFPNDEVAVNGEFVGATAQGLGDGWVDGEVKFSSGVSSTVWVDRCATG